VYHPFHFSKQKSLINEVSKHESTDVVKRNGGSCEKTLTDKNFGILLYDVY